MDDIEEKSFAASVIETVKTVVYALLIAGVFRTLFFQPFWIPSGSMKDSLLIGDFLFVNKMAYGYSYASCPKIQIASLGLNIDADDFCGFIEDRDARILGGAPERGDVVVFRHPVTGADYIKRLVGLPGDKIQMQGGVLQINGTPVARKQWRISLKPLSHKARSATGLSVPMVPWGWAQIASSKNTLRPCPMASHIARWTRLTKIRCALVGA